MTFNHDLDVSSNELRIYSGEMILFPHQGDPLTGEGSIDLTCGAANRDLRVRFKQTDAKAPSRLPGSADGRLGPGTTLMCLPLSEPFYVFVTSGFSEALVGESSLITGNREQECEHFELYLLNCLTPGTDTVLKSGDWVISCVKTKCAYDLTRVSLPSAELNLTHRLSIARADGQVFRWRDIDSEVDNLVRFLSFANCSRVSSPVIYGYEGSEIRFCRFQAPSRSIPVNRRSWATQVSCGDLNDAFVAFRKTIESEFWANIFRRAIDWQILAENALYDSVEQALSTAQMLLELLSYVLLVEDAAILSEDGYGKIPASDRINLLCSRNNLEGMLRSYSIPEVERYCAANSISSVGELITSIRNRLIHPTRKNRDYLDQIPASVRGAALMFSLQIASLTLLKLSGYRGTFFDVISHKAKTVPWVN